MAHGKPVSIARPTWEDPKKKKRKNTYFPVLTDTSGGSVLVSERRADQHDNWGLHLRVGFVLRYLAEHTRRRSVGAKDCRHGSRFPPYEGHSHHEADGAGSEPATPGKARCADRRRPRDPSPAAPAPGTDTPNVNPSLVRGAYQGGPPLSERRCPSQSLAAGVYGDSNVNRPVHPPKSRRANREKKGV